jgi:putative ABC transport system permease protein
MTPPLSRTVKMARCIHKALLVLAPRHVRRTYRAEMIATFEAASADANARGAVAVWRLLLHEIRDFTIARSANRPAGLPQLPSGDVVTRPWAVEWMRSSPWRQAWRSLRRRPAFLTAAVLTLGFGTGITTAVFSLVDTALIKPLPYPDADRLVTVYESSPAAQEKTSLVAPARLADWQRLNRSFVAVSGSYSENVTDTSASEPERLEGRRVMPHFFDVFGTEPLAGRTFIDAEEQPNGPGTVVISERFWARRYQRDPAAVGRSLTIGGRPYQIVGVMPATFTAAATDVWLPAQLNPYLMQLRDARFLGGIGRVRRGVPVEAAARDLALVEEALGREYPKTDRGWSAEIRPLKDVRIGDSRRGLVLVFGAVVSLWIIAVANIAGLTLVQVHRRARELAIRAALGASPSRVIAAVMREGLLIALFGAGVGAALAAWLVFAMPAVLSTMPRINELALDWRALAFVAGTSLLAACAFGLVPAFAGSRAALNGVIAAGSRTVAGTRHRLQKTLVICQVALSVLLVGSATLLLRSYYNLTHVETGFDASGVVTFHVGARWDEDRTRIGQIQEQLLAAIEQLPHVQAAGMTNFLPATGATLRYQVHVDGLAGPNADGSMTAGARMVGGGYLRALRARLVAGSGCPPFRTDVPGSRVAIVNQRFVDVHAPDQNLVGRSLRVAQGGAVYTIGGVVANLAEDGHATSPVPYVYACANPGWWPDPEYVVRTADPRAFATDLRRIVREVDSARAVFGLRPLQDVVDAALDRPRLDATMLGLFAGAAVTLAAIGLYSLFMLVVSERAREMAVRLAIGAAPRQMVGLVMTGAGRLLAAGIVLGIAVTAAADRVFRGLLFGVSPLDAPALIAAALTLAIVCAIAVAGPALKAARTAPIDALRGE